MKRDMFVKKLVKWIMLVANIVAAISLLMTLVGTVVSPVKLIIPAYFALLYPIILITNIGFVLFWIFTRKWFFLISLSLMILSANEISNTFPIHVGNLNKTKIVTPIKLLSYNTKMSGELVKDIPQKRNNVIRYASESNADIICLQEFEVSLKKQYITLPDMMKFFKKYPYKHIEFKGESHTSMYGIATFSKYPIVGRQQVKYTSRYNMSIFTDINVNGTTIRLINNHLESNRITESDRAKSVQLKEKFDPENLTDITLLFSRKLGTAYKLRSNQADTIADIIAKSPYKVIVCGDFNDVPASYAYTKIKGSLKDAFSETGLGFGWTFKEPFYGFRIDYMLYDSSAFTPRNFEVDHVNYSDHYPISCQFNINKI
jgi:endonuclease/exonuclease/phosphatase family metal-dependent hydrolase